MAGCEFYHQHLSDDHDSLGFDQTLLAHRRDSIMGGHDLKQAQYDIYKKVHPKSLLFEEKWPNLVHQDLFLSCRILINWM